MNCQLFEEIIVDLARDRVSDESIRVQARTHSQSCSRCAGRLADEQALTAMIRLPDPCAAPEHIENALLAAYRERFGGAVRPFQAQKRIPARMLALAASLLVIIAGSVTFKLLHTSQSDLKKPSKSVTMEAPPRSSISEAAPKEKDFPKPASAVTAVPAHADSPRPSGPEENPAQDEVASDFIPLTSNAEISTMESGQIVRILLPRTAMASYGLPVNQERADVPVSAQVLIGQDGVARAIRFLSDSKTNMVQAGMHSKR